jgi:hypothetical protein
MLPSGAPEVSSRGLGDVAAGLTGILRHNQLLPAQIQQQQQQSGAAPQQQRLLPHVVLVYNDAYMMQQHLAAAAAGGGRQQHEALRGVLWVADPFR